MEWTADITNDPSRDYDLCVDLWEGNQHRATIFRNAEGEVRMTVYPGPGRGIEVPVRWLVEVLQKAEEDLSKE